MKELFSAYYFHPIDQVSDLWNKEDTLFVFDTNILLNLYLSQEQTRKDIFTAIRGLENRVWIPYQVALEYQKNRVDKIAESRRSYKKLSSQLDAILQPTIQDKFFKQLLGDNQYHSIFKYNNDFKDLFNEKSTQILELVENNKQSLNKVVSELKSELNNLTITYPQVNGDDPIRNELDMIFRNKVGNSYKSQNELDIIFCEGEERYKNKIPPGFEDRDKTDIYFDNNLKYLAKFGDLIIFKQICSHSLSNKIKNIIFITEDNKEDWHEIYDFEGKKHLGTRREIKQEALNTANIENFIIINTEKFLISQQKNNSIQINKESINEVKEIVKKSNSDLKNEFKLELLINEEIESKLNLKSQLEMQFFNSKMELKHLNKEILELKSKSINNQSTAESAHKENALCIQIEKLESLCHHLKIELEKVNEMLQILESKKHSIMYSKNLKIIMNSKSQ